VVGLDVFYNACEDAFVSFRLSMYIIMCMISSFGRLARLALPLDLLRLRPPDPVLILTPSLGYITVP